MRRYALLIVLLLPQWGWAMDFRVSAGSESFLWQEYETNGAKLLEESGLRHFVAFDADSWIDRQWQSDFGGRVYSGTVDYDGQTNLHSAVTTDTDYDGIRFEAGFSYYPVSPSSFAGDGGRSGIRMALGVDTWRRSLHDTQLANGTPVSGYVEHYEVVYGRIAAHYGGGGRLTFNLGTKYPFAATETVDTTTLGLPSDVSLHPQGRFSLYADIGFQITPSWGLMAYYDSYRFAKSDPVLVGSSTVAQPESHQDTYGAKLSFTF